MVALTWSSYHPKRLNSILSVKYFRWRHSIFPVTLSIVPLCMDTSARMIDKCLPHGFYVFLIELRVINTLPKKWKENYIHLLWFSRGWSSVPGHYKAAIFVTWWYWVSISQYQLVVLGQCRIVGWHLVVVGHWRNTGQYWLILDGTGLLLDLFAFL